MRGDTSAGRALLGLLVLLAAAACRSVPEGSWSEGELPAQSERVLWRVTGLAFEKAGFPGGVLNDAPQGSASSGWHVSLAPFKGKGWRERATVRAETLGEGRWKVGVRVERERNDNMTNPLDLARAEWKPEPDNAERARLVLQYIRSLLAPTFEVGPARGRREAG